MSRDQRRDDESAQVGGRVEPTPGNLGPGKRTLTESLPIAQGQLGASEAYRQATGAVSHDDPGLAANTRRGVESGGGPLPHHARIQDLFGSGHHRQGAVQRAPVGPGIAAGGGSSDITPPKSGIDKAGFIDHSDGANLRTGPAESGGKLVRDQPLPPATRVFVSGTHPSAPQWWYVTVYLHNTMVRGYVQDLRVTTDLPEPTAELHQIVSGDTAEKLAIQRFGAAVTDGHDLRYYENVLLYVNQQQGRAGVTGSYQAPGVLGGGSNNVQLVANHRIWLVSPAYAKALESVVPDGSLTGGAVAKVKRFVGHLQDILRSVTEARHHLDEVAGEYAQAIRDHEAEIIGIVAGFIMAEATSAFLSVVPTGVTQVAAVVIQLALSAFGAAGMVQAGVEALKHGGEWLTTAWTAKGNQEKIAAASKAFLKMLVSVAMAALSYTGAKGNFRNALTIGASVPTGGLPALATAAGGQAGGASAGAGVLLGPSTGSIGAAGAMMTKHEGEGGSEPTEAPKAETPPERVEPAKEASREAAAKAAKAHVHGGGIVKDPQSPYFGKWDGTGIHDWNELTAMCQRDGFNIKSVAQDPVTGGRRVEVERSGVHPKTGVPVRGIVEKTIYPKRLTAAQIDAVGESAFEAALKREPGTKLDPVGTRLKRDGTPADGFFEATVKAGDPPHDMKIQGWYKETAIGEKVITSHTPAYQEDWPTLTPEAY